MAVTYRFARTDDADELGALHTRSWQAAYRGLIDDDALDALDPAERADMFRGGLARETQKERGLTWVVAEENGTLLGHAMSQLHEGVGHLHVLYLHPDAWGRGVGHALHDMAIRGLKRLGADHALLRVLDGNQQAITFYERHGWTMTGARFDEEMFGIDLVDLEMRRDLSIDVLAQNEDYWTDQAVDYAQWQHWTDEIRWGIFAIPDNDVADGGIFPDVDGLDVIELGCGTAYVSNWARQRGAKSVVALDYTAAQLATAAQRARDNDVELPLLRADAHRLPFADNSCDLAINEYGAAIWCDPHIWIPEAARILRPGGRIWFLGNAIQYILCAPEFEAELVGPELLRPQKGIHRFEWIDTDNVEFHVSHGEMITILTSAGFVVEALHELYAPPDTPPGNYGMASGEWASQWPIEEVWVARLPD